MAYKVQFLSDDEFNLLPAKNVHTKVGVAYPETGEAFVRSSGSRLVDVFTAMHELEHLQGDDLGEHFDAENKCYYKDFGQTLAYAAPIALSFIPGVGPAIGGALSSMGGGLAGALGSVPGVGSMLGGAAQSIGGGLGAALGIGGSGAGSGYAANAGRIGSEMGGYGIGSGTAAGSAAASGFGGGIASSLGSLGRGILGNVAGNSLQSMLGGRQGNQMMNQFMPSQGAPNISAPQGPNVIAGASGTGSSGGPGGAPGGIGGGGGVKKFLQQQAEQGQFGGFAK